VSVSGIGMVGKRRRQAGVFGYNEFAEHVEKLCMFNSQTMPASCSMKAEAGMLALSSIVVC
jgi:hypothetical protein